MERAPWDGRYGRLAVVISVERGYDNSGGVGGVCGYPRFADGYPGMVDRPTGSRDLQETDVTCGKSSRPKRRHSWISGVGTSSPASFRRMENLGFRQRICCMELGTERKCLVPTVSEMV